MDKETFINILKVLFLKFSSFIFLYPLAIIISQELGAEGYGIYGFVTALSAMLAVFCTFGSDQMLVREIAKKEEKEDDKNLAIAVSSTTFLSFSVTLILTTFFCVLYLINEDVIWAYVASAIPIQVVRKLLVGIARGYGRVVSARFSEVIVQPAIALSLVFLLNLLDKLNLLYLIVAIIISYVISSAYSAFKLRDKAHKLITKFDKVDIKFWMFTATPFLGMAFSNTLIVYADRVMLGILHSYTETGIYLVAARNASLLMVCFGCIQFVVGPKIAKLSQGSTIELQSMANLHVLLLIALGFVVMVPLFLLSDFLISLFGDEFSNSKDALFVLLISYFLMFLGGAPTQYLFMMGASKVALKIIVAAMVFNITLNLILIPEYGAYGASIATGVSLMVKAVLGTIILFRKTGIHSSVFGCIWLKLRR